MLTFVGQLQGGQQGHDNELGEEWFMRAKDEDLELKNKINQLDKANLSAED